MLAKVQLPHIELVILIYLFGSLLFNGRHFKCWLTHDMSDDYAEGLVQMS